MTIRQKVALLVAGVIMAVVLVDGAVTYHEIRSAAIREAGARAEKLSHELAELVASGLRDQRFRVGSIATGPLPARFLTGGDVPLPALLQALTAPLPADFRGFVELFDAGGTRVAATVGAPPGDIPAPVLSLAQTLPRGGRAVAGSMTLRDGDAFLPTLSRIEDPVADTTVGYVVAWTPVEGAGGTQERIARFLGPGAVFQLGNRSGDLWTDLERLEAAPSVTLDSVLVRPVRYGGPEDARVGAAAAVGQAPLVLLVSFPMAEVLAPARATLNRLALMGALLHALGLVVAFLLASGLTRPLRQLADVAEGFGAGRYTLRMPEPETAELRTVARAFNGMAERIHGADAELRKRLSEIERSEARHRTTQERLRRLVAATNAVIYEGHPEDPGPGIRWVSENAERILGWSPSEILADGWWRDNVHADDLSSVEEWLLTATLTSRPTRYRLRNARGEFRWIRDERRAVALDEGGAADVVVGTWLDITEQQELERQLRESQKLEAVGRLAGGIAHDFNNMLTVVLGEAEVAQLHLADETGIVEESLESLVSAATSAALLTQQLLTFSRRDLVELEPLDVNQTVHALHSMLRRLVGADVTLELDLSEELWRVRANRSQLEQILTNLIVNARDATGAGGSIIVRTENIAGDTDDGGAGTEPSVADHVVVSVTDTGSGMTPEVLAHIFEPFFTTKPVGKGTGLGLATSWAIAERLGGTIEVESEEGEGTTMRLCLPRWSCAAERPAEDRPRGDLPVGDESVLIVEDEPAVRAITVRALREHGYRVSEAGNGAEALALLSRIPPPDLVLSDLVMPVMGGFDLARRLREVAPDTRILFMTGYAGHEVTRHDLMDADTPFLQKPFKVAGLVRRVREVLDD